MNKTSVINIADLNPKKISEIVLEIRDSGSVYVLVQDGIELAVITSPVNIKTNDEARSLTPEEQKTLLEKCDQLSQEIADNWQSDESAAEAISNDRR